MTEIPHYSYEDLRKKADEFLREHYPSGEIPIPIEEIVEFDFNVNIVPVLGLQREFEVEGFTSGDLKNIYAANGQGKSRAREFPWKRTGILPGN